MNIDIEKKISKLLNEMTLKEKIGQLHQEPLYPDKVEQIKEKIRNGEIGSLILATSANAGNDEQHKNAVELLNELERIAVEESRMGIPVIFGRDVIHGHNTVLPVPLALAATFNPELVEKSYRCVAKEAANDGIHWAFSPMIDISRDPRWGRCIEGVGEDPYLGEKMAEAVVRGFQGDDYTKKDSIAACAKHYIGYGAVEGGRDYGKAEISDYTLRNYYLKPFKAAVDAGVATVMNSFNEVSGMPTTASEYLLNDLLKKQLSFEGFVVSDWGTVWLLMRQGIAKDEYEAAQLALNAGLDMDMVSGCFENNLEKLVNDGKVSVETIDKAVFRILYIKFLFGIFENPYLTKPIEYSDKEHEKTAKCCSDESLVLLKNKNYILPLSADTKILVTGPFANEKRALLGSWTLDGDMKKVRTFKEAFKDRGETVVFPDSDYLWDDCLKGIRKYDAVVVLLGESQKMTGEANSLAHIELPLEQLELVKKLHRLGKPIIGVMSFGRPIALEEAEPYFDAILYSWHSGTYTADSVLSVLYGDENPSGCVPMSFPRCTGQIPIYYNYPDGMNYGKFYYSEDVFAYNDNRSTPLYPFGYGLSYTEFEYSNIYCPEECISYKDISNGKKFRIYATVKNTGSYDGKETSQCYIRDKIASMTRPLKELKGISKNYFKVGEEKQICFELGFDELAFYNANAEFKPEPGEFEIYVGRDCYAPMCFTITISE